MKSTIDNTLATISKKSGNLIELRFKQEEYEVNVEHQLEFQKAMAEMTKDESKDSLSLMVIPGKYGSISKEAREMEMFTEGIYTKFIGLAIVTSAIHQRLLGTLFFKFKKAKSPTPHKFFKSEQNAMAWLKEMSTKIK